MTDYVDKRGGAYDPVTPTGNPQPPQVKYNETPHELRGARMCVRSRCPDPTKATRCRKV